jgi:outer membrane beta-barrel protein
MNTRAFGLRWFTLALCLVSFSGYAQKAEEEAGDVSEVDKDSSGPLKDRIRPVSGHLLLMDGRFEVSPLVGLSVRDAFFTKFLFGLALNYHFTETWGLSLRGAYTLSIISGAAQICTPFDATAKTVAGCRLPTVDELTTVDGRPQNRSYGLNTLHATLDLQWAPIYGKLSLFAEKFLSFNMYVLGGPALVMYGPSNSITVGGNVGLGFRFFFNRWVTLRTELRDLIYSEQGFPTPERDSLRNQLTFEVGLSLFLPTVFEER